jgi:hypothetical protein
MLEILKSLLTGTPLEGLLKLFSSLFGDSETSENQQNTNEDSSPQDNPLPSNEPHQDGGTTSTIANGDFNLEDIWKKVEDIFGGGTNSNDASEPENDEIEPPTEPEMEPDEPETEPEKPKTLPKVEPIPSNQPEPISAPEPEAQPMPSAKELEEASQSLGKESDNAVAEDESLGFEPEAEANNRLGANSKKPNEDESLGFEPETEGNDIASAEPKKRNDDESLGFEKE